MKPTEEITNPTGRYGTGYGKPIFPAKIDAYTTLSDLAGIDSWYIFYILGLSDAFLTDDVTTWPQNPDFKEYITKLQAINVINDSAERGVKLSSDCLQMSKSEEHDQNVLQVVEKGGKENPDLRKFQATVNPKTE